MTPLQSVERMVEDLQQEAPEFESKVRLVARAVEPEMRATLSEFAKGEVAAGLRQSGRGLASLMGTWLTALRARAGGWTAVVAIGSRVVPGAWPRALRRRASIRGLLLAAVVAGAATALAFAIGSLLRSRRRAALPTSVTPPKEPFVIPIIIEPEPVLEAPEVEPVVMTSQTPEADAREADGAEASSPTKAADIPSEPR